MQSGAVGNVGTTHPTAAGEKMLNPHKPPVNKKYNDQCGQKLKSGRMADEVVGDRRRKTLWVKIECLYIYI